jgi:hypothetical protein
MPDRALAEPAPGAGRTTSVVTRRGLEITTPTPNVIIGCLVPLVMLLGFGAIVLYALSDLFIDGTDAWTGVYGQLFGWGWLALGGVAAVLVMAFSSRSNQHLILGTRQVRYQHRLGRVVMHDEVRPLSTIDEVEAYPHEDDAWEVRWRSRRRHRYRVGTAAPAEAEALAERIRAWLEAPGRLPVEADDRRPAPLALAEAALSLVSTRLTMVIPLSVAAAALLMLATVWQVHQMRQGRAEPLARLDRVADGELTAHRWHVHAPHRDSHDARVYLRIAIDYTAEDGVRRTLWLASRRSLDLWELRLAPMQHAAAGLGVPGVEFDLPPWAAGAADAADDWAGWRALARLRERTGGEEYHAANLLARLDEPYPFLQMLWTAPAPDWRVAYAASAPERAMPLTWVRAEREALRHVAPNTLLVLGGAAAVLILWTLPRVVAVGTRRWIARSAALGVVLAVPWWAGHAERAAGMLGVGEWTAELTGDALRLTLAEPLWTHAGIRRARAPAAADGVPVRWTPARSAAAELLRTLDLDTPPAALPLPDPAAATAHMVERASAALARMSDAELVAFARGYETSEWYGRADGLHEAVVEPALCPLLADRARPTAVHSALWRLVPGTLERRREVCPPMASR